MSENVPAPRPDIPSMAIKVLVFESDPVFADELQDELAKLGCFTTVVDDGNLGLQQAISDRPDLILLSIELPRMNGFSVCNKLKKDPNLKDVPLIIMSTESTDETFEQHKKLRTRAEDYVHKPIAFGELLLHIQGFVPLTAVASDSDGTIVIDDEIEIGTDYVADDSSEDLGDIPMAAPTARGMETVDADIDAFAESAFGRLTSADASAPEPNAARNGAPGDSAQAVAHMVSASSVPARPPSLRSPAQVPAPGVDRAEYERVCDELTRVKERFDEVDGAFEEMRVELERLRGEAADAELRAREIEELRAKLTAGAKGASVSSREFLDLREALNKKDKELLTLKEVSSKKDRLIVEAQDRALVAERAASDLDERLLSLERERDETKEKNESLVADRDLAKKASDDFRTRLEKTRAESEAKDKQLIESRERHADELMVTEERFSAIRAELDQTLANERAEHARAVDQAEERRKGDLDRARREHEAQLATARNEWHEESERANADATRHEQASLEELRGELHAKAARDLEEINARAATLSQELTTAREQLTSLRQSKEALESSLTVRDARIGSLDVELGDVRRELAQFKERLAGESARADRAQEKWDADRQSLERAKDALAVALAQIEEAEGRPLS